MPSPNRRPRRPKAAAGDHARITNNEPGVTTTGRYIALLRSVDAAKALSSKGGLKIGRASEFRGSVFGVREIRANEGIVLDEIGVAILEADPDQASSLSAAASATSDILAIEPERIVWATQNRDRLLGYQAGVNAVVAMMYPGLDTLRIPGAPGFGSLSSVEDRFTWGLQATKAHLTKFSGKGVKVAVLDTGVDLNHADFTGRVAAAESFVNGSASAQDGNGHGTHCAGTACGPQLPGKPGPRHGIAFGAELFIGKVLDDAGRGGDGSIMAGINWAVKNGCDIISMSFGGRAMLGDPFSEIYEATATDALQRGILFVAAAGNGSARPGRIAPVDHPANCPSIMAVAAVDSELRVAGFSNAGLNAAGGKVDIAAPGVGVISAALGGGTSVKDGTSMATPHVAGIAALFVESNPGLKGAALWAKLQQSAMPLTEPSSDVGTGLVQAP